MAPPIAFSWTGTEMAPLPRFQKLCDREFVVGEVYSLIVHEERSPVSHRHYFVAIKEAWKSLPEGVAERFATSDHLRKYALIKAGYADERSIVCSSKAEALRVGAFVRPVDEYAIVTVNGAVVTQYTAKSQSMKAMNRHEFQKSKTRVLEIIAEMIGISSATLERQGRAA